ncbi:hypothetical protein AKJ16_DCAP07492, partial [Drosera capensis]
MPIATQYTVARYVASRFLEGSPVASYIMVACSTLNESIGAFRQFPEPFLGGSLRRTRGVDNLVLLWRTCGSVTYGTIHLLLVLQPGASISLKRSIVFYRTMVQSNAEIQGRMTPFSEFVSVKWVVVIL